MESKNGSQKVRDYRRRRKENLIKVCGSKCNLCGYNKTNSALEFHHINPLEKEYAIASCGTCHDLEKDLQEISKCILVCANCHREIHDNLFSQEELVEKRIFNEDIANELRKEKEKKTYFCKHCGKAIGQNKTGLCNECYLKMRWEEKKYPDREELKSLIRNFPFTEIGKMYKVTDNAVKKWCRKFNLPFRKKDILQISDIDWLKV